MNIDQAQLVEYNAVVVFRELRFTQILSELARRLLPEHPSPLITEIPQQLLTVVYPDRQIQCQFANRRVQVSDKRGGTPGEHPFGLVTLNALEAVSASSGGGREIVAYGYNYTLRLREMGAMNYVKARFFSDGTRIENAFDGTLQGIGFAAIIKIPQRNCLININLGPNLDSVDMIDVMVNYHYERQSPVLSAPEIGQQADQQYNELLQALRQL